MNAYLNGSSCWLNCDWWMLCSTFWVLFFFQDSLLHLLTSWNCKKDVNRSWYWYDANWTSNGLVISTARLNCQSREPCHLHLLITCWAKPPLAKTLLFITKSLSCLHSCKSGIICWLPYVNIPLTHQTGVVLSGARGRCQSDQDFSHRQLHRCSEPWGAYNARSLSPPHTPHAFCVQLSEGKKTKRMERWRRWWQWENEWLALGGGGRFLCELQNSLGLHL